MTSDRHRQDRPPEVGPPPARIPLAEPVEDRHEWRGQAGRDDHVEAISGIRKAAL